MDFEPKEITHALIVDAARNAHEMNKRYCELFGDRSQPPWGEAPDWQKESAIAGARAIAEHPDLPASASHEGWMAQKIEDGWEYGEVKDAEAKTHPCMVDYDELPTTQRAKDHIFGIIVRASLGLLE